MSVPNISIPFIAARLCTVHHPFGFWAWLTLEEWKRYDALDFTPEADAIIDKFQERTAIFRASKPQPEPQPEPQPQPEPEPEPEKKIDLVSAIAEFGRFDRDGNLR